MQPGQATCGVEKSTSGPMRETAFSLHSDTFTSFLNNCLGTLHSNHFLDKCRGGGAEPAYLEHLRFSHEDYKKAAVSGSCPGNRIWLLLPPHTQGYHVLHPLAEAEQACPPVLQDTSGHIGILKGRASHSQGYSFIPASRKGMHIPFFVCHEGTVCLPSIWWRNHTFLSFSPFLCFPSTSVMRRATRHERNSIIPAAWKLRRIVSSRPTCRT